MPLTRAVAAVHRARRETDVVITAMGVAREWMKLEQHPLDFVFVPSSMGQAIPLGLGMAIAQPSRRVIVCTGDGATLMNLGSLVTLAAERPTNLAVLLFDNGVYEVTGAQPTPGTDLVDFAALARACGLKAVARFSGIDAWEAGAEGALNTPGPSLTVLDVAPVPGGRGPRSPGPTIVRARSFIEALRR